MINRFPYGRGNHGHRSQQKHDKGQWEHHHGHHKQRQFGAYAAAAEPTSAGGLLQRRASQHLGLPEGRVREVRDQAQLCQLLRRMAADASVSAVAAFGADRFRQVRELRNAIAHNQYPNTKYFKDVVAALSGESVPDNSDKHRCVAERLSKIMKDLYRPWLNFLEQGAQERFNE